MEVTFSTLLDESNMLSVEFSGVNGSSLPETLWCVQETTMILGALCRPISSC